jgi:serine protease Do
VFEAVRIGIDPRQDLAALRVEATDLPAATIGDSDALRVGELVLAMGNPLGLTGVLTTGIIHEVSSQKWIMADVRLAPGNSGGPLADARGRVIGINTMIANGLGVAIPSKAVERFLRGSNRPQLGVTLRPVQVLFENKHVLGLLILSVKSGSAAEEASFQIGDVLIGVRGQLFATPDNLTDILGDAQPGEVLPLEFLRSGKHYQRNAIAGGEKDLAGNPSTEVKSP